MTGDRNSMTIVPFVSLSTLMVCNHSLKPEDCNVIIYVSGLSVEYLSAHTSSIMARSFPMYFNLTRNNPLS